MIKISIIIPLFNKELSVHRAINSVLNQTIGFEQLIIVDDGSTDNSLEVVRQFADKRIRILSQSNQGVSVARNNGAKLVDADYVCFLDADDQWEPHFLEEMAVLINQNKMSSLYCARYSEVDEKGKSFIGELVNISDDFCGQLSDFFSAYRDNRSLFHPSASCINMAHFRKIGQFPVGAKIGEDIYLALQLALSDKVMFTSKRSSTIFRNAENRTNVRERLKIPYHIKFFLNKTKQNILEKNPTLKVFLLYNTTIFGLYAVQTGNRKLAFVTAKLLWKQSVMHAMIVLLGACLPKCVINLLKKLRNKKTLSYEN